MLHTLAEAQAIALILLGKPLRPEAEDSDGAAGGHAGFARGGFDLPRRGVDAGKVWEQQTALLTVAALDDHAVNFWIEVFEAAWFGRREYVDRIFQVWQLFSANWPKARVARRGIDRVGNQFLRQCLVCRLDRSDTAAQISLHGFD